MAQDLFDQLADWDTPPVPEDLPRQVHHRLNERLLVGHLMDVILRALPYAFMHLASGLWGLVAYTLGAEEPPKKESPPEETPPP